MLTLLIYKIICRSSIKSCPLIVPALKQKQCKPPILRVFKGVGVAPEGIEDGTVLLSDNTKVGTVPVAGTHAKTLKSFPALLPAVAYVDTSQDSATLRSFDNAPERVSDTPPTSSCIEGIVTVRRRTASDDAA